jgi:hypothetical protein
MNWTTSSSALADLAEAERERRRRRLHDRDRPSLWSPYPDSPQERAYHSRATIIGYGGAAGGGKSSLALGLALTAHRKSIIFRREAPQLREIIEQSRELVGNRGRFNSVLGFWRLDDGRTIELASIPYEHNVSRYRGRPHDLIVYDEATEFSEFQVRSLMGWLRTTDPTQHCRVVLTFNPPSTVEGQWILRFFAAWLDETHPHPADPGELRWYAMVAGKEVERPDGTPFEHDGETITPLSRTFFPARLQDNPALARTGYGTVLQGLPEPLRSQLLYGDFKAGLADDAWQVLPTAWVKAAMARWTPHEPPTVRLYQECAGLDVAHGGGDKTVLSRRKGNWFAELLAWEGIDTSTGSAVAERVVPILGLTIPVNVDAIAYGASAYERLREDYRLRAYAIDFGARSTFIERTGTFGMRNVRAEAYWRLREALDPESGANLALPPDQELLADLVAIRFKVTPGGILIEAKEEIRKRLGRSIDKGDAVALAYYEPPSVGFAGPPVEVERERKDPYRRDDRPRRFGR